MEMLQEAVVTKTFENGLAEVVVERSSICGGNCDECSECQYDKLIKSTVENTIDAHRGQHVVIETPTAGVYKGAFSMYLLPIIFLIVGYYTAAALKISEGKCILIAFIATAVGVLIASVLSKKSFKGNPVPTKIISVIDDQK